jgi:hypothetical protein
MKDCWKDLLESSAVLAGLLVITLCALVFISLVGAVIIITKILTFIK